VSSESKEEAVFLGSTF